MNSRVQLVCGEKLPARLWICLQGLFMIHQDMVQQLQKRLDESSKKVVDEHQANEALALRLQVYSPAPDVPVSTLQTSQSRND